MFKLYLLHIRRSDFAFIWIRCSDFICITFSSTTYQMFRLRLLHIRCSDFAFIWIRCSDFICITCASTTVETFRLYFLQIKRSDFAFIWIRCSDFICITFANIIVRHSDFVFCIPSVQTLPLSSTSYIKAFRLRLCVSSFQARHSDAFTIVQTLIFHLYQRYRYQYSWSLSSHTLITWFIWIVVLSTCSLMSLSMTGVDRYTVHMIILSPMGQPIFACFRFRYRFHL